MAGATTHILRASLRPKLYRDIEIDSGKSLYDLAEGIVQAFDFDLDHAFGFYGKLTGNYTQSPLRYELFADMDGGSSDARSVKRTTLLSAAGVGTMAIVRQVGKSKRAVWRWRERFVAEGVDGLLRDRPRSGRPPMVGPDQVRAVVERTVPPDATHWSTRSLARAVGLGKTTIQKIWREHGLKPHLIKGFKVSREPAFVDKVRD